MADVLNVSNRESRGSRNAKRDRAAGKIPAILYGQGAESISISVCKDELNSAIRHGARVVDLQGDLKENAFIREVQWDAFGIDVLHVDFTRVTAGESIEVTVSVELRGEAPGAKQGGVVNQALHQLEIECPVMSIPEKLQVTINDLQVGANITADQVELPEGSKLLSDPTGIVVSCVEASADEDDESPAAAMPGEPEVIGRKAEDEEADA